MDMCCICEELRWKDAPPLEIVYTDERADKYCIFHAPKDHKGVDDQEFERRVHERIRRGAEGKIAADGSPVSNLCGTIFPGEVWFERANHGGLPRIYLEYAEFWGRARFKGITFDGAVDCSHAVFHTDVDFSKSTFSGAAVFDGAKFHGAATFSDTVCNGQASFIGCTFKKVATFISTHFKDKCQFTEATFCDFAAFQLSVFENDIEYIHTTFKKSAYFHEMRISKQLLFSACASQDHGIKIHRVSKHSLGNLILNPGDLQLFSFWCCDWPAKLYQEIKQENSAQAFQACEELYRAMKQRAAEEHDQLLVSRWHYREKLMAMKRGGDSVFEALMLRLYFISSGFGERALQALGILLVLLALSFLANAWTPSWDWNAILPWANAANATMSTIPFAKDIPGDGWVKVGRGFWQLLIAVQFTLFALAVRNRFRR